MNDYDLMVRAAWMYYHDGLTHAQIAQKLHLNRVKVTRLLQKARDKNIVEIRVTQPMPPDLEMSRQLEQIFGLEQAIVVRSPTGEAIGQAAAELLLYQVKPEGIIGFGWSRTVSELAPYVTPKDSVCNCTIVDLIGTMIGTANPYSVSGKVADILHGTLLPLAVPMMVSSQEAADTLLEESSIAAAMNAARNSHVAFIGVGEVGPESTLVNMGKVSHERMADLQRAGVVGEMLMRYFDINGNHIEKEEDERIIGLGWDDLHTISNVVLVAHGPHKVNALIGALRSGIASTVITDMPTAQALVVAGNTPT